MAASSRPYVLSDAIWPAVAAARWEVAVLPWGATEAHNRHLPYATDTIQSEGVAVEAARLATESGARVMVLPGIPFGTQSGQLDIPLCIHLNPSSQLAVLRDVVASVERAGIGKLVLLNGHGGNDFRALLRELQPATRVFLCTVNWYSCIDPKPYFKEPGDHAGELETSVMLHLAPALVRPLSEAGPGRERRFKVKGLREGWAWAPRRWTQVTEDTGVGNPVAATGEKGAAFFAAVSARIGEFLVDLAKADAEAMYG